MYVCTVISVCVYCNMWMCVLYVCTVISGCVVYVHVTCVKCTAYAFCSASHAHVMVRTLYSANLAGA